MLHRLIYISRSLVGTARDGLDTILSASIRRNAEAGVTGMLWTDGGNFAQVIEGDAYAVGQTMDRIRGDRRHSDIEILFDRAVSSRQFGGWSMRHAVNDEASAHGTAFIIGFAMNERTAPARRLYDIIEASDLQGA